LQEQSSSHQRDGNNILGERHSRKTNRIGRRPNHLVPGGIMGLQSVKFLRTLGIALAVLLAWTGPSRAQSWQRLHHQPNYPFFGPSTALLLTDGTVMVQSLAGQVWLRLTPDANGSYVNGTWSQLASLPSGYSPEYYASAVLPDGRVIIEGGEINTPFIDWTNLGAIYDPTTNTWAAVTPPSGWNNIGDAAGVVLSNGQFMLSNIFASLGYSVALLNSATLTWTQAGQGKADGSDEEGWTLLPNGQVLTVDVNNPSNLTNSELYDPVSGDWTSAGSTIVKLDDTNADGTGSHEVGPAVLRPDGTVFATGATGHNSIYDTKTATWIPGPDFPDVMGQGQLDIADGPASLLPSGNVLVATSPGFNRPPTHFFEFDGVNLTEEPVTPNSISNPSYVGRMLLLPTGQVLFTDGQPNNYEDVEIYTPSGTYNPAWAPTIASAPTTVAPGASYVISGYRFNGFSQAVAYGDDVQAATNYPLVRITNRATGHVFYSRTHDHSTMAVAFAGLVSTHFDVPVNQELGASDLVVVANGIPSDPIAINVVAFLSTQSLSFSPQAVGTTSAAQTVTLSNTSSQPLLIYGIKVFDGFGRPYAGDFSASNNCGKNLAAGQSCSIAVSFTPTGTGARTGSVSISDNAPNSPQTVSLIGIGALPTAVLSFTSAAFLNGTLTFVGSQAVGTTSPAQTGSLTNQGPGPLLIYGLTIFDSSGKPYAGDFSATNDCAASLEAGNSCSIAVSFTPTGAGTRSGSISISDNASNSPQTVSLTGTGALPVAALSTTGLSFGQQTVGTISAAQTVTLSNLGPGALMIYGVTIFDNFGRPYAGDFSASNNCGKNLAAGQSCTIAVSFTPTGTGARTGSVSISDNAPNSPQTVSLTGAGR
jgi:hypothetical protein